MIISPIKAQQALEIFGLAREELTEEAMKRVYRAKAKECHPDKHGTDRLQEWSRLDWAKTILTELLKQSPPPAAEPVASPVTVGDCRACGGSGRVPINKGFRPMTMQCVMCEGQGTIVPKEKSDGD